MKISFIIFLSFLFLVSGCDSSVDQNNSAVQIIFKNNSNYQLKNLVVSDKSIGTLSSNSSSKYFSFNKFCFDTGMPDEDASSEVNGRVLTNHYRGYWCGTEKITIDSGVYLIEIDVLDTMLYLSCKNAPVIN